MRQTPLIGIFSIFLFSSGISAETSKWKLEHNEHSTSVRTVGTAEINELRLEAILGLSCDKNFTMLRFEIADYDKAQKVFDIRIFEGPNAPTRSLPLTTIELEGASPAWSMSVRQNGFISVQNKFVFETGGEKANVNTVALAQLYRRMAKEGNLLRIRIKSYRDPKQFITSVFPLNDSREAIAEFAAACGGSKSQPQKPARSQ
jgi:hypothetical protein